MVSNKFKHLNCGHVVLRSQSVTRKLPPTPLHHPESLIQGRMDLYCDPAIQMWKQKWRFIRPDNSSPVLYCLILGSLCDTSSSAVSCCCQLLQRLMFCTFRDALLHTLVLISGYLSYSCLPISSNQASHFHTDL